MTIIDIKLAIASGAVLFPWCILTQTSILGELSLSWITAGLVRVLLTSLLMSIGVPLFEMANLGVSSGDRRGRSEILWGGDARRGGLHLRGPVLGAAQPGGGHRRAGHGVGAGRRCLGGRRHVRLVGSGGNSSLCPGGRERSPGGRQSWCSHWEGRMMWVHLFFWSLGQILSWSSSDWGCWSSPMVGSRSPTGVDRSRPCEGWASRRRVGYTPSPSILWLRVLGRHRQHLDGHDSGDQGMTTETVETNGHGTSTSLPGWSWPTGSFSAATARPSAEPFSGNC